MGSWNSLLGSQLARFAHLKETMCSQQPQGRYPMTPLWARHLGLVQAAPEARGWGGEAPTVRVPRTLASITEIRHSRTWWEAEKQNLVWDVR